MSPQDALLAAFCMHPAQRFHKRQSSRLSPHGGCPFVIMRLGRVLVRIVATRRLRRGYRHKSPPHAHGLGSCDKKPCASRLPQRGFSFCLRLLGHVRPTVVATRPLCSRGHHKPCPSQQPRRHILPPTPSPEQHGRRHNVRSRSGRPLPTRRLFPRGPTPGRGTADARRPLGAHQATFASRAGPLEKHRGR